LQECDQAKLGEQAAKRRCRVAEVRTAFLQTRRRRRPAASAAQRRPDKPRFCAFLTAE
jgi:hypothetical protein